jgi:hypothetical protein
MVVFDGFDDCVIGYSEVWGTDGQKVTRIIYEGRKMIRKLMSQGMSEEEAWEYFQFNIDGAYVGPLTPIILHKSSLAEILASEDDGYAE